MGNCTSAKTAAQDKRETLQKHAHSNESSSPSFSYTKGTCALEYWEPTRLIGEGSISSIHLVKQRPERVDIPYKERVDIMKVAASKKDKVEGDDSISSVDDDGRPVYALKSIMKDHVTNDRYLEEMRKEIHVMSHLVHPNIVKVLEAYERKRHIYLIMEYCSGGDLYQVEGTSEALAQDILKHILLAVKYMHEHKVVHRDLKMENIMFKNAKREPAEIKIIDFGLSTTYLSEEYKHMTDKVGTVYTMCPQVLQGVYDFKCDLWSVGVITYILLSGSQPFWGPVDDLPWSKRRKIMMDRIMRGQYKKMKYGIWDKVSQDAKNFVAALLQVDPKLRPTAAQALNLPWMQKICSQRPAPCCGDTGRDSLQRKQKFTKLALNLVAHKVSCDEILQMRKVFSKYDPYDTGVIGNQDFQKALLDTSKWSKEDVASTFSELGDGCVEYVDFLVAAIEMRGRLETERIAETLDRLDAECNCKVSKEVRRASRHTWGFMLTHSSHKAILIICRFTQMFITYVHRT